MPKVTVTVENDKVVCKPDPRDVRNGVQTIQFKLDTDGYVFPDLAPHFGIDFDDLDSEIFTRFTRAQNGKLVNVVDQNHEPKNKDTVDPEGGPFTPFKYTVTVVRTADQKAFSVDPRIRNYG